MAFHMIFSFAGIALLSKSIQMGRRTSGAASQTNAQMGI
jgi:hypothetical protein